jgi:hypothetical protein
MFINVFKKHEIFLKTMKIVEFFFSATLRSTLFQTCEKKLAHLFLAALTMR